MNLLHEFKRTRTVVSIFYLLLVILYFMPIELKGKLAYPLTFLTLVSLWKVSWPMTFAMLFSALGDCMAVWGNFWGQMMSFALAHIAFIVYFVRLTRVKGKFKSFSITSVSLIVGLMLLWGIVYWLIALEISMDFLRWGVMGYTSLILVMCWTACLQENRWYALGTWLFVFSDTVLAWNRFVSPICYANYCILLPYYVAQWVILIQSLPAQKKRTCF